MEKINYRAIVKVELDRIKEKEKKKEIPRKRKTIHGKLPIAWHRRISYAKPFNLCLICSQREKRNGSRFKDSYCPLFSEKRGYERLSGFIPNDPFFGIGGCADFIQDENIPEVNILGCSLQVYSIVNLFLDEFGTWQAYFLPKWKRIWNKVANPTGEKKKKVKGTTEEELEEAERMIRAVFGK